MIKHSAFKNNDEGKSALRRLLKNREIILAGNAILKIYGHLNCSSGKRMLKKNRVFFISEEEAIHLGYRPCGHCMRAAYKKWKIKNGKVS